MIVWWNEDGIIKSGMIDDNVDITKPVKVRPFFGKDNSERIVSKVYRSKAEARDYYNIGAYLERWDRENFSEKLSEENAENWALKISVGMKLITEGCKENEIWKNCHDCPFERICEILMDASRANGDSWEDYLPMDWEIS